MNFKIEKTNTPMRYDMRAEGEYAWAIIVIDERSGFLAIQSDYGDYQYMWPRHGRASFKHFLADMSDTSYILEKVTHGERKLDMTATVDAIGSELATRRKEKEFDKETYKALLDELSDISMNSDTEQEFYDQLTRTEELSKVYEDPYGIPFRTTEPQQAKAFFEKIWPAFIQQLKQEIADERRQESSQPL